MNWILLVFILLLLLTHAAVSAIAVLQTKRFWGLNKRNRRMSIAFLLSTALIDGLILIALLSLE